MDYQWTINRPSMDYQWIINGPSMDHQWTINEPLIDHSYNRSIIVDFLKKIYIYIYFL